MLLLKFKGYMNLWKCTSNIYTLKIMKSQYAKQSKWKRSAQFLVKLVREALSGFE